MLYVFLWLLTGLVIGVIPKISFDNKKNLLTLFTALLVSGFIGEFFLLCSGTNRTYLEVLNGYYQSCYSTVGKTYYHSWPKPNEPHQVSKQEYSYWRPTNSLGFPDEEWPLVKSENEKRVLFLGDSFTEGDGASYDSSFVSLLNPKLNNVDKNFYLMNAGVCGSDPFFNYINLKDRLLKYKPDYVIQSLSTMDLTTDILIRGGIERFQTDGTLKYNSAPWWEPIYAVSYLSRIFFRIAGYNELLQKNGLIHQKEALLNKQLIDLFTQYYNLCEQNNIRLIIVLRPDETEIINNKYQYNFSQIFDYLKENTNAELIDLLPAYNKIIKENRSEVSDYFWKYDGHHNSKGYEIMAQSVYENIIPLLKDEKVTE